MDSKQELVVVDYKLPALECKTKRLNYVINVAGNEVTLVRDVDFGKLPTTKKPTLLKAGAEKILFLFGLRVDVEEVFAIRDVEKSFFYFEHKAIAYDNKGNAVRVGYGCCNTLESSFGMAKAFNSANNALKKSEKRAIVDLALKLGACSDMFTQDMEDEANETEVKQMLKDTDPITSKQRSRLFAIASKAGITQEKTKELLSTWGYQSTKDILVKDYDNLVEKLQKYIEDLNDVQDK